MTSAAVVVCLLTPSGAIAAPSRYGLEDPEAIAHADAAAAAGNVGDYDKAIDHLKAAYAIEPLPVLLYAWAQAERLAGNYHAAVALYEEFLEQNPDGEIAKQARVNLLDARTKALEQGPPETTPEQDPDPEPVTEPGEEEPSDDEPTESPLEGEKLAPALLGVGAVIAITGGALMGVGAARVSDSPSAATEDAYFAEIDVGRNIYYGGAALLGAGGLIIVGGAIRYAVVAKRGKAPKSTAAAVVTPRMVGLSWSGRF